MKIAIAGFGIEGKSNYNYWASDPKNIITIFDQKQPDMETPAGIKTIIGDDAFDKLMDYDLVVRTAGLTPRKIKTNGRIWTATNEFFAKCPAQIIGVTGSKGKGTTASLIASMLEAAGKKVWLVGNIGSPALDVLGQITPTDIVVYELSSFQLWDIEKSPHIAIILFIEQEHLDNHSDMNDYIQAKTNITKYQKPDDVLIYNQSNQYAIDVAKGSIAQLVGYPNDKTAHVFEECFYYNEQKICSVNSLSIVGKFNYDNACAAIDAVWGITNNAAAIEKGLAMFKGLPHRLQLVRELDGVKYYDDSIATIPGAAIAALRAFDESKVIILGGSSKGSNFTELGSELKNHDVSAILVGDEAENIAKACRAAGFSNFEILNGISMAKIVSRAQSHAKPGGVVLLSPACASFGLFKNYSDRGNQFIDAVNKL